jgi:hypothetical protein
LVLHPDVKDPRLQKSGDTDWDPTDDKAQLDPFQVVKLPFRWGMVKGPKKLVVFQRSRIEEPGIYSSSCCNSLAWLAVFAPILPLWNKTFWKLSRKHQSGPSSPWPRNSHSVPTHKNVGTGASELTGASSEAIRASRISLYIHVVGVNLWLCNDESTDKPWCFVDRRKSKKPSAGDWYTDVIQAEINCCIKRRTKQKQLIINLDNYKSSPAWKFIKVRPFGDSCPNPNHIF